MKEQGKMRLEDVMSPRDLRGLSAGDLYDVAEEIRERIIDTVSKTGGHLASSLGVVELTLALHTSFDTPKDKIVWDVGHQCYAHKLITGRYGRFHTLRTLGGLSGFPKRHESPYDIYDTGHAAGSISYALGLASARDARGEDYNVVAVIGDGSLSSGIAWEGLNNAGELKTPLIVVVNDNSMSISKSVGGMSYYLNTLRLAPAYREAKARFEKMVDQMPNVGHQAVSILKRLKGGLKHFLFPEAWFESFGFRYYGPIDGHDIEAMQTVFRQAISLREPVVVHVITQKGRGYPPAMADPEKFHGPGPFDPSTGEFPSKSGPPSWSKVFGEAMCAFAERDPKVVAVTAAMTDGTGLSEFGRRYPERLFDVGIAESHAVTYAAGLAQGGLSPVVAIYSTFLQRAFDQIIEDVCLQGLKVVFAIDRAGIVGQDGETHHGEFDLSYLRLIPGLTVMAPKDERELVNMLYTALEAPGPWAIRYPRGSGQGVAYADALENPSTLETGRAETLKEGTHINLIAIGSMVYPALEASEVLEGEGISCGVINARFLSPLDETAILRACKAAPAVVLEENVERGGLSDAIRSLVACHKGSCRGLDAIALPCKFIEHGPQDRLRELYGLDKASIVNKAKELLRQESTGKEKAL